MIKEDQEQALLIKWLKLKRVFYFAVNNENQSSFTNRKIAMIQEAKAKSKGKIKGASDLIVMIKDKILFIELKRSRKILKSGKTSISHTKTSREQLDFLDNVNKFEYADGKVCYGWIEAKEYIESFN